MCSLSIILLLSACSDSINPKKRIAVDITQESCQFIGDIIGDSDNLLPGYMCECFTYYVSKDLMENFTNAELREIKKDDIKKIMVLTKLYQTHQEEVANCIQLTTEEIVKNYADFERQLDKKLNSKTKIKEINNAHDESILSLSDNGKTVVKMEKINGVYEIPTEIDGIPMYFIFDTGAGLISISTTEASFLYKQGKLTKDDIKGTANFSDANGDISEGTIIVLKTVKIGDRILENIEASVVNNLNAPLLFGQSALGKFGKISIDNNRGEITFE